jgi:hypothetical protein
MATAVNFTSNASPVNAEFVQRGSNGLQLVKQILGLTLLIPIKPKVKRIETGLLISHEFDNSRSILINLPNGQVSVLEVTNAA